MGVEQVLLKKGKNLSSENFSNIFGPLNTGSKSEISCFNNWSDYISGMDSSNDIRLLVTDKKLDYFLRFSKEHKLMYIHLPELKTNNEIVFVRNAYLYLLARECLVATTKEADFFFKYFENEGMDTSNYRKDIDYGIDVIEKSHEPKSCVVSAKIFPYEKEDSIVSKLINKRALCIDCFRRFPEEFKSNYINGILLS